MLQGFLFILKYLIYFLYTFKYLELNVLILPTFLRYLTILTTKSNPTYFGKVQDSSARQPPYMSL